MDKNNIIKRCQNGYNYITKKLYAKKAIYQIYYTTKSSCNNFIMYFSQQDKNLPV